MNLKIYFVPLPLWIRIFYFILFFFCMSRFFGQVWLPLQFCFNTTCLTKKLLGCYQKPYTSNKDQVYITNIISCILSRSPGSINPLSSDSITNSRLGGCERDYSFFFLRGHWGRGEVGQSGLRPLVDLSMTHHQCLYALYQGLYKHNKGQKTYHL